MEHIPNHDKYLDPPDPPTHSPCDICGGLFDTDDLNQLPNDRWYCDDCLEERKENERQDWIEARKDVVALEKKLSTIFDEYQSVDNETQDEMIDHLEQAWEMIHKRCQEEK